MKRNDYSKRRRIGRAGKGKGGFTLAELCVAMALIAILGTVIVSFCVLVSNYTKGARSEYDFLEESGRADRAVSDWIYGKSETDTAYEIKDGVLYVGDESITFKNGTLKLGSEEKKGFSEIDSIVFSSNESKTLIKATVTQKSENGGRTYSFVIYPRLGSISGGG